MNKKKIIPDGIYGITAEKFSLNRSNPQVVEEMISAGVKVIQYREKRHHKKYNEILEECQTIRKITQQHNVTFIINDFVDIALLVDADGVHVGQEDLPVSAVRQLIGPDKIIGLSTHSPQEAIEAEKAGADYIGVGPIFATQTKEDVCAPVGFNYLEHIATNSSLPFVAIGGIKLHNINKVISRGAKSICLVTEIVGSENITETVHALHKAMKI